MERYKSIFNTVFFGYMLSLVFLLSIPMDDYFFCLLALILSTGVVIISNVLIHKMYYASKKHASYPFEDEHEDLY